MSEGALWLNYCLSAALAFVAIYKGRWQVVPAIVAASAITLLLWLLVSLGEGAALDDPWLGSALIINGLFSLVFGGLGAFLGFLMPVRDDTD